MQLSTFDKSRVRYHLGYFTVSVPAGDYARLEESMNTIPMTPSFIARSFIT